MFCHSLVSDWNHGNAHFLRGVVRELLERGHPVRVFEPRDGWSRANLLHDHGPDAVRAFRTAYPRLNSEVYDRATLNLDDALHGADVVLVHEWNDPALVARIGVHRATRGGYRLLFHDTHHRSVTDPDSMAAYDLRHYDGVLAFGDVIRDIYVARGWASRAWTWHEAADTRVFYPRRPKRPIPHSGTALRYRTPAPVPDAEDYDGDVVWIGNWGDEERTAALDEFLLGPVRELGLRAAVFGVRYPADARARLAANGVSYRGWLPNTEVPAVFARYKVTVHIPRRPYLDALPGVPTIRPFEALACAIPLICAGWDQTAGLFRPGEDFLVARDGREMTGLLAALVSDPAAREALAARGLETIAADHTCAHRVDELLWICDRIPMEAAAS
jgi:spore maturation protein CgeB